MTSILALTLNVESRRQGYVPECILGSLQLEGTMEWRYGPTVFAPFSWGLLSSMEWSNGDSRFLYSLDLRQFRKLILNKP